MSFHRAHAVRLVAFAFFVASSAPASATSALVPVDNYTQTAVGYRHACGLTTEGEVECWGNNSEGQLGDGTQNNAVLPTAVINLGGVAVEIVTGNDFSCARLDAGSVRCWGSDNSGQLGNGNGGTTDEPETVQGLPGAATRIFAGENSACAIVTGGSAHCWGYNDGGQLGDGTKDGRQVATSVSTLTAGVTDIAIGVGHACAVYQGQAWCWGQNGQGQLGDASETERLTPVQATVIASAALDVAVGQSHSCAVMANGETRCWGDNNFGQLGLGSALLDGQGELVLGLPLPGTKVFAAANSSCVLGQDAKLRCWGSNTYGVLGDGSTLRRFSAVAVDHPGPIDSASISFGGACIITQNRALCWGDNSSGQLGNGVVGRSALPSQARLGGAAVQFDSGAGSQVCARTAAGAVQCWGANSYGEVGDGSRRVRQAPVNVAGVPGGFADVRAGNSLSCGTSATGAAYCWGLLPGTGTVESRVRTAPVAIPELATGVRSVRGSSSFACALMTTGAVQCWGSNFWGQLGDAGTASRYVPGPVSGLTDNVDELAVGFNFSCARRQDLVRCWGDNSLGQLGTGTITASSNVPLTATLPRPAVRIAVASTHACAIDDLGDVYCWGSNFSGELGHPGAPAPSATPTKVAGLDSPAARIAGGQEQTCVVETDGDVLCWGANYYGQLGSAVSSTTSVPTPVVGLPDNIVDVTASADNTCALAADGRVFCWGEDQFGQAGNGGIDYAVPSPVLMPNVDYLHADGFELQ